MESDLLKAALKSSNYGSADRTSWEEEAFDEVFVLKGASYQHAPKLLSTAWDSVSTDFRLNFF